MPRHQPHTPRLALQVGILGASPDMAATAAGNAAEPVDYAQAVTAVLQTIHSAYTRLAQDPEAQTLYRHLPQLKPRILTTLLGPEEQAIAAGAVREGYQLHLVLPYLQDCSDEALLLRIPNMVEVDRCLRLDGDSSNPAAARVQAEQLILRHADVVLGIWQPHREKAAWPALDQNLLKFISDRDLPIIWINAQQPEQLSLLLPPTDKADKSVVRWQTLTVDALLQGLRQLMLLRDISADLRIYYDHAPIQPGLRSSIYPLLFAWFAKNQSFNPFSRCYETESADQWQAELQKLEESGQNSAVKHLEGFKNHFIHADSLATYYADEYRGTFVISFLLSALAVLFAALAVLFVPDADPSAASLFGAIFSFAEFLVILALAFIVIKRGKDKKLHQRWLDFRLLAEQLRQHIMLAPISARTHWRLPKFHSLGDDSLRWIDWHMRSLIREQGIPRNDFNAEFMGQYLQYLGVMLKSQITYHENNAVRNHRLAEKLESWHKFLLNLVIAACLLHAGFDFIEWLDRAHHFHACLAAWFPCDRQWFTGEWEFTPLTHGLSYLSIVLPALGAAFAGILVQGEFRRVGCRSEGMRSHLQELQDELQHEDNHNLAALTQNAERVIDILSQELFDWRVIFRAKPLETPA